MLKKIIILAEYERQENAVEKMKENMGGIGGKEKHGRGNIGGKSSGAGTEEREILFIPVGNEASAAIWTGSLAREGYTKEELLFVTDSPFVLHKLKQEGMYVAAWIHGKNRQEDLSGAIYAVEDIEELDWESFERIYLRLAGKPWTVMETERCIVREMTVEDVEAFYHLYAEPSITYYMEDLFPEIEEEIEYTKNYIEKIYGFYGYGLWSIVCKENHEVIGRAGLSWREGFDTPELGFVIGVPYQRKGYAYEVCRAIVAYGKEELGFEKIQALMQEGNKASACLCRKLGFRREGRVEDKGVWYERYINGKK